MILWRVFNLAISANTHTHTHTYIFFFIFVFYLKYFNVLLQCNRPVIILHCIIRYNILFYSMVSFMMFAIFKFSLIWALLEIFFTLRLLSRGCSFSFFAFMFLRRNLFVCLHFEKSSSLLFRIFSKIFLFKYTKYFHSVCRLQFLITAYGVFTFIIIDFILLLMLLFLFYWGWEGNLPSIFKNIVLLLWI